MNIFDGKNYTRLDDDVSFQIVRTNPKLTTNTKLMYDGENLYMESYSVNPLLSTTKYKHHRVWKSGLYNRDIKNFLMDTDSAAYDIGRLESDTSILNNFDNQYENIYWCGAEAINSDIYPQEIGFVAPLYLRKKRPNYFVIFKIDTPANTNLVKSDILYEFKSDILNRAQILKAFDLREGTPIGDYIKKYVEQKDFKYDQSLYVNFSSNEIYYYGIDKKLGVLTQKVENFKDQLLDNDNTIMKDDEWITSGFERNNLIFPYILNIEFLFDDKNIDEYRFARYFGMYCNDIDLCDFSVGSCVWVPKGSGSGSPGNYSKITTGWKIEDSLDLYEGGFYYIKDKYGSIYSIKNTTIPGVYKSFSNIKEENLKGFEPTSTSVYAERIQGIGKAFMILEVDHQLVKDDTVEVYNNISGSTAGTFVATPQYGRGEFYNNRFSCKGTVEDIAEALAGCIRNCTTDNFDWVTTFTMGNKIIIQALYPGTSLNGLFSFSGSALQTYPAKIKKLTDEFSGGTDVNNCIFKVYTSDKDVFFDDSGTDRDRIRYVKCGIGRENATILSVLPYINDNNEIDDTYSIIITDAQGPYVTVSQTNQIELLDKFYPRIGVLSMFPVRDFDFDTSSSAYGDYSMIQRELKKLQDNLLVDDEGSDTDSIAIGEVKMNKKIVEIAPYKRFYEDGQEIGMEYDYYCENILPEQATMSKTVPYITKWGYGDEGKDSCENPYRLNANKIFEACNFSANTFMQRGDISEFTHSMPYYIIRTKSGEDYKNEYQYIAYPKDPEWAPNYESMKAYFSRKKSDGLGDPFEQMFGDTSTTVFSNKRFNKKYSRFLYGNDVINSSTMFRGVKFELVEMVDGKEIKTGKFNGYRFSFVYVPVKNGSDNTVHFIKNDDYKFIVGIVFFNIHIDDEESDVDSNRQITIEDFNKALVYAGAMGYLDIE